MANDRQMTSGGGAAVMSSQGPYLGKIMVTLTALVPTIKIIKGLPYPDEKY